MSQVLKKIRLPFSEVVKDADARPSSVLRRMLEAAERKTAQKRESKLRAVSSVEGLPRPFAYD